jgi:hypothetical protein
MLRAVPAADGPTSRFRRDVRQAGRLRGSRQRFDTAEELYRKARRWEAASGNGARVGPVERSAAEAKDDGRRAALAAPSPFREGAGSIASGNP